jgi:hypothetical protein
MAKKKKKKKEDIKVKAKASVKEFEHEFSEAMVTAMTAAFGFLMALTWRDVIVKFVEKVSGGLQLGGEVISALIVTFICVLGVMLIRKTLTRTKK